MSYSGPDQQNEARILYDAGDPSFIAPAPPGQALTQEICQDTKAPKLRWLKRLVVAITLISALTLALTGARSWGETRLAEVITSTAKSRGWEVSWGSMQLGYDLTLRFKALNAVHLSGSHLKLMTTEFAWRATNLLSGDPRPSHFNVSGMDAELDISDLQEGELFRRKSSETTEHPALTSPVVVSGRKLLERGLFERLKFSLTESVVTLKNIPNVGVVQLDKVTLNGEPGEGDWGASFDARCTQGCDTTQHAVGQLKIAEDQWLASLQLESPVKIKLPGKGGLTELLVQSKQFNASLHRRRLTLGARDVFIPIEAENLYGTLNVAGVSVTDFKGAGEHISLVAPVFTGQRRIGESFEDEHSNEYSGSRGLEHLVEALPSPLELREMVASLTPRLKRFSVSDGVINMTDSGLRIDDIEAMPGEGSYRFAGRLGEGRGTVALNMHSPHIVLELEQFPIQPYASRLSSKLSEALLDGQVSGQVRLNLDQDTPKDVGQFLVDGHLQITQGRFEHLKITPVGIHDALASVDFTGSWRPPTGLLSDRLEFKTLTLTLPSSVKGRTARVNISGSVEHLVSSVPLRWQTQIWLDETPCDIAIGAIPRGMLPNIWDDLSVTGSFAPKVTFNVDLANPYALVFKLEGLPGTCLVTDLGEFSPAYLNTKFSQEVREGVTRRGIFVGPGSGRFAPIRAIPRHVTAAMYLTEERAFRFNSGFALSLLRRALRLNFEKMRYVYGGSSIEQQLVKNLFLTRDKTLSRKLEEAFIVWRMGDLVTKDRIIELYMNCIEFAPNVYGIARASWYYFNKPPSRLTPMEGVFLAVLKPAPQHGSVHKARGSTPAQGWWHKRTSEIMRRLRDGRFISQAKYEAAAPYILYFPGHKPSKTAGDDKSDVETRDAPSSQ